MEHPPKRAGNAGNRAEVSEATNRSDGGILSTPVEWRDISTDKVELDTENSSATQPATIADANVSNRIQSRSGPSMALDTDMLTVTLVGIPRISVADLVYTHDRKKISSTKSSRFCAMFVVENTSTSPVQWRSQRTKFIGSDGYTYDRSHVSLDPSALAPGCHTTQIEIEPKCRARVITPVETLPQGIDVAKVIHTVPANKNNPKQRLIFTL